MTPKFPNIEVDLSNSNGNAVAIMGRTAKALRRGGATPEEVADYRSDAKSGDYDHVIQVTMAWVDAV
jgi:hypothetical protein